jgi:hypothetical protein
LNYLLHLRILARRDDLAKSAGWPGSAGIQKSKGKRQKAKIKWQKMKRTLFLFFTFAF